MNKNEQIKKALSFLIKAIPVDVIKNNQEFVDDAVGDAVDVIADKQYKEPIKLVRTICKYVPIEAIQNNLEFVERIVQAAVNKDTQQIMELINEFKVNVEDNNQQSCISFNEAEIVEELLQYFANDIVSSPQNFAVYMFKLGIESFISICESIKQLEKLKIIELIAEVKGAKKLFNHGISNPDSKIENLKSAQEELFYVYSKFEDFFYYYLEEIKKIDDMPTWKLCLSPKIIFSTNEIDTNIQLSKLLINGIIQIVNLQIIISHELKDDINSSVIMDYNKFCKKIISNKTCDLLQAYDKKEHKIFWLELQNRLNQTLENKTLFIECFES